MNVLQNNKGNALLLVLLITVIFTALGLSIIASTIGGTKRTEIRKEEIDKAFASIKVIDQITADLSAELQSPGKEITKTGGFTGSVLSPLTVSGQINLILEELKAKYENPEKGIEKIDFKDVTTDKNYLTRDEFYDTLTRVYEIYVTAKTGEGNGNIRRTATKRLIISPLPSFLKYAVGSENGTLILNGSPNINGDIFVNQLKINKEAEYYTERIDPETEPPPDPEKIETPYPSVIKDIYASEFNSGNLKEIIQLLQERDNDGNTYFYKDKVPVLKNDSQYQEIYFEEAFEEEQRKALEKVAIQNTYKFSEELPGVSVAAAIPDDNTVPSIDALKNQLIIDEAGEHHPPNGFILTDESVVCDNASTCFQLHSDLVLTNKTKAVTFDDLYVNGDILIVANKDMTFKSIYATGTVKIISNGGDVSIQGDVGAQDAVTITNNKGHMSIAYGIATRKALSITNKDTMLISNDDTPQKKNLFAKEKIYVTNETGGLLTLNNDLVAGEIEIPDNNETDAITLKSNDHTQFQGNIISLKDKNNIKLLIYDNSKTKFEGNVYSGGKLILRGNAAGEAGEAEENDELWVDGVMYAREEAEISNLNIVGLQKEDQFKQLILLSGGDLLITRINEFSNYKEPKEEPNTNYVPADHIDLEDLNIKPLKGFFYTNGKARLYGVGSLFYVDGGIFAKEELKINAIRGEIKKNLEGKPEPVGINQQLDRYSRFIVNHNTDVLLQNFETLPKVKYLSIYSDDLTVE